MAFPYSTLNSHEIRLLTPVVVPNGRELFFSLETFRRDRAPSYTAISYTWGNDDPDEVIHMNGVPFPVRRNLWSCLHYLCFDAEHQQWSYIWADALCIDQTNSTERNQQVRVMDEVYRKATCVSVWLGLAPVHEPCQQEVASWPEPIKTLDVSELDWHDRISDLANRPYWSRFWVIQEFLLGREVEICCGNSRINWMLFKEFLSETLGVDLFATQVAKSNESFTGTGSCNALPLLWGRHPDLHPETLQPLCELLQQHQRAKCKDPRDRVFALLGLIPSDERECLSRFFPDYRLSEDDVLAITIAHLSQAVFCDRHISTIPKEVFVGLGIEHKEQRQRLRRRAAAFDYLGRNAPAVFSNLMNSQDLLESSGIEDSDVEGESVQTEMFDWNWKELRQIVSGLIIFVLTGWIIFRNKNP